MLTIHTYWETNGRVHDSENFSVFFWMKHTSSAEIADDPM